MLRPTIAAATAGLVAVLALVGCSSAEQDEVVYHSSYPAYASATELADAASLVVVGEVLSSAVREIDVAAPADPSGDPELDPAAGATDGDAPSSVLVFTVHQVRVDQVLEGDAAVGDVIEVSQLGGKLKGREHREEGATLLKPKKSYALYLQTYENGDPASLLNATQSAYERGPQAKFSPVDPENPIGPAVVADLKARKAR